MKRIYLYMTTVICVGIIGVSCKKAGLRSTETEIPENKAFARFAFFSPNTPAVAIKVDDQKINGTATLGAGGLFPASFAVSADYAAVTPGATLRLSLMNTGTLTDSVLIFANKLGLEADRFYTVTLADTGVDRSTQIYEDVPPPRADSGFTNLRFINLMPKTPNVSVIRIDSASSTVVTRDTIFRNVAYRQMTNYVTIRASGQNAATVRYRMIYTANGQPVGTQASSTGAFNYSHRNGTIYGVGFGNGTGSLAPGVVGVHINR